MRWFVGMILALSACGDSAGPAAEATCDLALDGLVGKTFVMAQVQEKGPPKPNPMARLTFVEDGGLKAKYTALSLGDVYDFECKASEGKDDQLTCKETPRLVDWCEAILAHGQKCTRKRLRGLGTDASDEELTAAVKAAKANKAKAQEAGVLPRWEAQRKSLGNKMQGILKVQVGTKCDLRISDLYWVLDKDLKKIEDSNPVGTNAFSKSDEPWMFEHCDNQAELFDLDKAGFPALPLTAVPVNALDKPIYYVHTGDKASKPADGCTYSFDTYAGWKPVKQGQTPEVVNGRIVWQAEHSYTKDTATKANGATLGIFHMARYQTCGGEKKQIDVACRTTKF